MKLKNAVQPHRLSGKCATNLQRNNAQVDQIVKTCRPSYTHIFTRKNQVSVLLSRIYENICKVA